MRAWSTVASCIVLVSLVVSRGTDAHECDYVGKSPEIELAIIHAHPDVRIFCARCGDKVPTSFHVATARSVARQAAFPAVIRIVDPAGVTRDVDVASVYVRLDPKTHVFTNVANRAVCEARYKPATI